MLRAQLKNDTDPDDDVLEVVVEVGFALPLVLVVHLDPQVACELINAIFPTTDDTHALVQFHAHIREARLPDVNLFEFFFDSGAERLRRHFKKVLHPGLRVLGVKVGISPNRVQRILDTVDKCGYLAQFKSVDLLQRRHNFIKMLVDRGCLAPKGFSLV